MRGKESIIDHEYGAFIPACGSNIKGVGFPYLKRMERSLMGYICRPARYKLMTEL